MPGFGFGFGSAYAGHGRRARLTPDEETPPPSATAPGAIPILTTSPGDGQVALSWTAPGDGGSAITDYTVQHKLTSSGTWLTFADGVSPVPGATITGLANGSAYDFRAAAVNAIGTGPWSDVASATPAGAALVVGPEYFDLADDFEAPPGVTTLTGRAHWSGDTANFVTDNGKLRNNVKYANSLAAFGSAPWTDLDATFDYRTGDIDAVDGTAWDYTRQNFLVWYRDVQNHIQLTLDTTNRRLIVTFVIDGASSVIYLGDKRGTVGGSNVSIRPQGTLRFQIKDGRARAWVDGRALINAIFAPPWDHYDLAAKLPDVAQRQGRVGARQKDYRWPMMDGLAARAADIVCNGIDGAVGRDSYAANVGTVTYAGWFSGAPVTWVSRLRDATDPRIVVRDWQAVTATVAGNSYSIAEPLPLGFYVVEHGWLDALGRRHTTLSPPTLVARRIIAYGQSTAIGRGGGGAFGFPASGAVPASVYNALPNYTTGYMVNALDPYVEISNDKGYSFTGAFQSIAGEPCMFEAYGVPGSTIGGIMAGTPMWAEFIAALATRKGVVEAVIWDQGQGDADVAPASFAGNLTSYPDRFKDGIVAPLRALMANPNLPVFISHMGRYGGTPPSGLTQAQFDSQRDAIRKMAFALTTEGGGSDPHVHSSSHHDGIIYGDAYHPNGSLSTGYGRLNERDAWSLSAKAFGKPVHDGRGPRPTGITRSGAVLTIALDINGATSVQEVTLDTRTGTSIYPTQPTNRIKGWDFSKTSDFATLLPVASLVVKDNAIKVTLAGAPDGPVYARHLYGAGYNDMTMVQGVYSGAAHDRTIPLEPTMAGPLVSD